MKIRDLAIAFIGYGALTTVALADDHLDIKGFHVGMSSLELRSHRADFCFDHVGCDISRKTPFTVGGVNGHVLHVSYDTNASVDGIEFGFDSLQFANLKAALLGKYPDATCKSEDVTNRLGTHFEQVVCRYETNTDGIYLARYDGRTTRSVMFVMSAEKKDQVRDRLAAARNDL